MVEIAHNMAMSGRTGEKWMTNYREKAYYSGGLPVEIRKKIWSSDQEF